MEIHHLFLTVQGNLFIKERGNANLGTGKKNWYRNVETQKAKPKVRNAGTLDAYALQERAPTLAQVSKAFLTTKKIT